MKWEYKRHIFYNGSSDDLDDLMDVTLSAVGKDGWELVVFTQETPSSYAQMILKRPIHEPVPEVSVPEATARVIDMEDIGR